MYLSRLFIKNYRSIEELNLKFKKGKNVILGRNNSGKSNILKAIDLILGDGTPTYSKLENVTENDFYKGNTSNQILIYCELNRDKDEKLNYDEIYNCWGYKIHSVATKWENKKPIERKPFRHALKEETFLKDLLELFKCTEDSVGYDTDYINPKLRHQKTFENQFEDKYSFAFCFNAYKDAKDMIIKDIRFLYREDESKEWILAFKATVRNELIKSAIIPSFRDPQTQLRVSNYTWYGKLLKNYIDSNNPKLKKAFNDLKLASDDVFKSLQVQMNNSKVKIAFPNTSVSFQFNPDTKQDVHKSALIYVDDGFNSQLQDKGAGIQSAVIIGLFDFYVREINKSGGSSLLAIEEPELYLHPHGRRVISERLDDFVDGGRNQVIITTHSAEFISSTQEALNIIVVKKDSQLGTKANNVDFCNVKEKQILLKVQNAEMFFADFVVLVEGADKYVLEFLSKEYGQKKKVKLKESKEECLLGKHWFDNLNISVIACGGKHEFWKYTQKLKEANIPHIILSDFDFINEGLSQYVTKLNFPQAAIDEINKVKSGIPKLKKLSDLDKKVQPDIKALFEKLRKCNVFILSMELEDYYKELAKQVTVGIEGKEQKVIQIITNAMESKKDIGNYIEESEFINVLDLIVSKLQ